jgi:hypothetical protein
MEEGYDTRRFMPRIRNLFCVALRGYFGCQLFNCN